MTQDEIIEMAKQASKAWLKEFPTPEETANQVPKRFLEIFAKLVAEYEREACAELCEDIGSKDYTFYREESSSSHCADAIRARGLA
jgi:hypothetical protein